MAKEVVKEKKTEEERILAYIKKQTLKWTEKDFSKTGEGKLSEKAENIRLSLEKGLKGIAAADKLEFAKLFSYVIGEEIPFASDDKIKLPRMVALVCLEAFDNHGYEIGSVVLHSADGVTVGTNGKVGAWLEPPKKMVRPATEAELDNISNKQLKGLLEESNIVLA